MVIDTDPLFYRVVTFINWGSVVMGLNDHMTAENLCRCASDETLESVLSNESFKEPDQKRFSDSFTSSRGPKHVKCLV